jgi:nitrogen fixation protein FixH
LGWRADAALALARPGRPGTLSVRIRDAAGQPLTGAEVRVEALHNARAAQRYPAELTEGAAGEYRTPTDAHRPGEWEVRVTAQRGPDRFTTVLRLTAGTPS